MSDSVSELFDDAPAQRNEIIATRLGTVNDAVAADIVVGGADASIAGAM